MIINASQFHARTVLAFPVKIALISFALTAGNTLADDTKPAAFPGKQSDWLPCCTILIEAECLFGLDSHHPIISLQGIPSAVIVFRILHPILASTLCDANPLARIAGPKMIL